MSKKSLYLLGILATIVIGTLLYLKMCSCCTATTPEPAPVVVETPKGTSYPFRVIGDELSIDYQENFNFRPSSFQIITPLHPNVAKGVARLKEYLDEEENVSVTITGFHTDEEDNNSAYPSLGLARANAIKNYFVAQGIDVRQLGIAGRERNEMVPTDGIYLGPCSYGTAEAVAIDDDALEAMAKAIMDDPLVLRFDTGSSNVRLTATQRQKFAALVNYLDKDDDATCFIDGHTDDTGNAENNMKLGQDRADFAKEYLVRQGISGNRIETRSFGSQKPIATNETDEGRAQNRRSVINIEQ